MPFETKRFSSGPMSSESNGTVLVRKLAPFRAVPIYINMGAAPVLVPIEEILVLTIPVSPFTPTEWCPPETPPDVIFLYDWCILYVAINLALC